MYWPFLYTFFSFTHNNIGDFMYKKEIVKRLVDSKFDNSQKEELINLLLDTPITVDVDKQEEENKSFGDFMADKISAVAGSWKFILFFLFFLIFWILLNTVFFKNGIDPYPFILLNLLLSCIAAVQAPIIMMSQHREAKRDSLRSQNDYVTDLKSELILEDLHRKLELVLKNQAKLLDFYNKNEH